ncbi:MAG: calcium/sodium antiporter [Clostridiales bacterium]|nr:calcium/sodium antiporter [Clostridiales bacterium]
MLKYLLLLIGFFLLIKGADVFVEGSASVAGLLKIPSLIIGLTVVSMGTSAPEAAVSITAALENSEAIAVSNVIGSNIFNILIVAGTCALIKPVIVNTSIIKRDLPFCIGATLVVLILAINKSFSRLDGIIMLLLFIAYMVIMVVSGIRSKNQSEEEYKIMSPLKSMIYIVIGIAAVILGGNLVVDNSVLIAQSFGVSETIIGLTIISVGTSLPELVTSIVATRKGQTDIALGNAIGSCIFNVIFILGASSAIKPIAFSLNSVFDIAVSLGVAVFALIFTVRDKKLNRFQGAIFLFAYAAYLVFIFVR